MKPAILAAGAFAIFLGPWALGLAPEQSRPAAETTPFRTCGEDLAGPALPVDITNVILAGDSRGYSPCAGGTHTASHREQREAAVVGAAATASDPVLRRAAAQALGKLGPGSASRNGPLSTLLKDQVPAVRAEAARAFIRALDGVVGERLLEAADVRPDPALVDSTRLYLTQHLAAEKDDQVAAAVMETLGALRYVDDRTRDEVETQLTGLATGSSLRVLGAAKGLEVLIRLNPKRKVGEPAIARLRALAQIGPRTVPVPLSSGEGAAPVPGDADNFARVRRLALLALQTARDEHLPTLTAASQDADWQVRRLVALRMDAARPEMASMVSSLARDAAFQVRYEMLMPLSRVAATSHECAALLTALDDASPAVVLRALDLVPSGCTQQSAILKKVNTLAASFRTAGATSWHVPARAVAALARLSSDQAKPLLPGAMVHTAWQVRAAAAGVAATLGDAATLDALARDPHANVQTAVLEAMRRTNAAYGAFMTASLLALGGTDHQLLRTAATMMPAPTEADRDKVASVLLAALQRLTALATDTSRDTRVAIVQRLAAVLPAARGAELATYMRDYDPRVRAAVSAAIVKITGALPTTAPPPQYRYPLQPANLGALPTTARITMADGATIDLELLVNDAPVTIARFAALARGGHYNGLTFHRIAPNFVVQGGSPGANEYAGVSRYMRDEIGAHHVRGAVGISTRGRDTGDLQLFIDHVDVPRLDHEYTVFARVTAGMHHVDQMLEGALMRTVTVK